jgi:hypothetical protein
MPSPTGPSTSWIVQPLLAATRTGENHANAERYVGNSFLFSRTPDGKETWLATCAHVVGDLGIVSDETDEVVCFQNLVHDRVAEVSEIRKHPEHDFALLRVPMSAPIPGFHLEEVWPGLDVRCTGFYPTGRGGLDCGTRLLKGYVTRVGKNREGLPTGDLVYELSFPALTGFSGSPVFTLGPGGGLLVMGMIYFNLESSVEVFSHTQVEEGGSRFEERTKRIIELGLAHAATDLVKWAADLGIERIQ